MSRQRTLLWLLLFVVASLLGYLDALGSYAASYSFSTPARYYLAWNIALTWDLVKWNLWVALAPLVPRFGRRAYLEHKHMASRISVYAVVGICFALLHSALVTFIHFFVLFPTDDLRRFLDDKYFVLISDALTGIIIYGLILVTGQALVYYKQAREGELMRAQLETQLAQAQLKALKMQLRPHFLFNALHSISANLRDTEVARSMIARLGDFLRLTLNNGGSQEVSLKEELEFLRCYLDIERARYRDRLSVQLEIDPDVWDARLPNLILQPIVENAIKHGIGLRSDPGRIDVRARRLNGSLQVEIQDNGGGLKSQPGKAFSGESEDRFEEGIGLSTTRERLRHLYKSDHSLEVANAPGGGAVVTLTVPFNIVADELPGGDGSS